MALAAAVLFGAAAPFAKLLLGEVAPQLLAGLLYLGAGIGLAAVHFGRAALGIPAPEAPLRAGDLPWLAAVVVFGGVLGPLLLMLGWRAPTPPPARCCSIWKASSRWASPGWSSARMSIAGCCSEPWRSSWERQSSPAAVAASRSMPVPC